MWICILFNLLEAHQVAVAGSLKLYLRVLILKHEQVEESPRNDLRHTARD